MVGMKIIMIMQYNNIFIVLAYTKINKLYLFKTYIMQ